MTKQRYDEMPLSKETLMAVKDMGFEEASPIQAAAIPLLMEKKDIIGQAQTGTGKTAAFAIPVIENFDPESKGIQAVVLCPTRELVIQVAAEFNKLLKYRDRLSAIPVYGGQQIDRQLRALRSGAQIIIGTPGRTMDHIRRRSIDMSTVKTVILDEADEMLDMGFRDDIEFILKDTPEDRQTVMFSATMEKNILALTKKYQKDAVKVDVTSKVKSELNIKQLYFEVINKNKPELLARLIEIHNIKLSLVFCNTKSQVDELVEVLKTRGYFADALHGDMNQNQRDKVMRGFRSGSVEILVATDVAGRGIDVNNVEAVFNYDLPRDDEDYTHRIGRTGRAGKSGTAFTFVTGKQVYNLKRIERLNGVQVLRQSVPSMDELEASKVNYYIKTIKDNVEEGHLTKYINQIELMMGDDHTSLDVAAVLLKLVMAKENVGFDSSVNFKEIEDSRDSGRNKSRRPSDRNFRGGGFNKGSKRFGDRSHGRKRDSARGERSFGDKPFGQKRDFDNKADKPFGDKPFGDKPFGDKPFGKRKDFDKKDKPFGDKPFEKKKDFDKKDKPFGDKPFGKKKDFDKKDRPFGDKPFGKKKDYDKKDKPFGDKPFGKKKDSNAFGDNPIVKKKKKDHKKSKES